MSGSCKNLKFACLYEKKKNVPRLDWDSGNVPGKLREDYRKITSSVERLDKSCLSPKRIIGAIFLVEKNKHKKKKYLKIMKINVQQHSKIDNKKKKNVTDCSKSSKTPDR